MLAIVIIVLIVVVCWGKVSIDSLDNAPRPSVTKTLVYLFLSIILCIIYYKTSSVNTNRNTISINKLKGSVDKQGNNLDKSTVEINHRMHNNSVSGVLKQNNYEVSRGFSVSIYPSRYKMPYQYDTTKLYSIYQYFHFLDNVLSHGIFFPDSNIACNFYTRYAEECQGLRKDFTLLLERFVVKQEPVSNSDSTILNDALEYILDDIDLLYKVSYTSSKTPSFFPYETYKKDTLNFENTPRDILYLKGRTVLSYISHPKFGLLTDKKYLRELNLRNATVNDFYVAKSHEENYHPNIIVSHRDSTINRIDYFTAADMSQTVFELSIGSDIPLSEVYISFDEPISISNIYPVPDTISMQAISYTDPAKLEHIRNHTIFFHVKFPTYENKQLLRSLVLTTVLVGVVSLFCINFFLLLKWLLNYLRSLSLFENRKFTIIGKFIRWFVFIVTCGTLIAFIYYAFDNPIVISEEKEATLFEILKALFYIICVLIFVLVPVIIINVKKKNKKI